MDRDMFDKAAKRQVSAYVVRKIVGFRSDDSGSIAIFVMILFVMMLYVGGIGVDVMRSEMRRVAYHQTLDRASLAASNIVLPPSQTPTSVAQDWWNKAGLGDELTVDNITPTITGEATASSRITRMEGSVRSYNWFMTMLSVPYFDIPMSSAAQQGVSKIEVMLTLDITGSMAQSSGSTTKIEALRQAASNFVTIMKYNRDGSGNYTIPKDPNNLISIGLVPYASNVNVPVNLRNQFTVSNLSWWNETPLQGVPNHNCLEINPSTFGQTELSTDAPIPMAAVSDVSSSAVSPTVVLPQDGSTNGRNGGVVTIGRTNPVTPNQITYNSASIMCNNGDDPATPADESATNLVMMPTTNITPLKTQIESLKPKGNTSIAVGMRWATALMDETARPIYTALRGSEPAMAGRPANNNDGDTRKIIVLMTDGNHVASRHINDTYKTGLSPIYRGADGNLAIRFTSGGPARTDGLRPGLTAVTNTCSGWVLAANREYFVPHLKNNSVRRQVGVQAEGAGTGTNVNGGCDPRAWLASPSWTGSGGPARQLDWSEVWRYTKVDWMVEQLYMRSNVVGTTDYWTVYNTFVANYLTNATNMDALLNTNCDAAKAAGFEVFGIVLGDNVNTVPIQNCSSPGTGYFYHVTNADDLNTTFEQIAVLISELRLTQ
jgi:Putative Flp pilus-assembly TadE/G-like